MDVTIRPVDGDDELRQFVEVDAVVFGGETGDEQLDRAKRGLELDRTRAAFADGRVVGSSGAFSLELTVPGGATLPASGVTWVGVLPTHRRRGVLTKMMGALLADAAERGEPLAVLLASESVIYGRFGFGLATSNSIYEIPRRHAQLRVPAAPPGRLVVANRTEAERVLPQVYDRYRRATPGEVSRWDFYWQSFFEDREKDREGGSQRYYVLHERAPGDYDGYAAYRLHAVWNGVPEYRLDAVEVAAVDTAVRRALLAFLFDVDLVATIRLPWFPVDDEIRWTLRDPRRLATTATHDHLWVRVLDVEAALSARTYAGDDRLVLEVADAFRPGQAGTYTLEAGTCRRTDGAEPDLALSAEDLGAAYLGGVTFGTLVRAGRAVECTPGAAARATSLFAIDPLPYSHTDF